MDTSKLKKFAQYARRSLIEQVQSKLRLVLAQDSAARREYPYAVKELEAKQKEFGDDKLLIEQVAYTWFNRFCALRFMDANQYNRIMVVSPIAGQFQPEILAEVKAGHLDESVFDAKTSDKIRGLLSGTIPSRDGQAEAYRLIIVGVCNDYHRLMPYLFERIEDYTELLMPEDLLSGNSILAYTREAMTPENCESVESIGWLYQFYISEKKDQVFEGLKKNQKITPENIPAATQLFTPHWIVKYLVENSLGRLWMLNNPSSKVIEQMKYYIKPVEEETDFLKISTPEELKICDPAAGSGHMLTYAYDLLYAIYLDANYDPVDIPELILTKNLYGIEIDERAAELAAFALSMKAMKGNPFDESNNRRRFFRKPIEPNICKLQNFCFETETLIKYVQQFGSCLFTPEVVETLKQFDEASHFGSLIVPLADDVSILVDKLEKLNSKSQLGIGNPEELTVEEKVLVRAENFKRIERAIKQASFLSSKYHVVLANPPYMGANGMNARLINWAKKNYKDSKSDLYSMFMERGLSLTVENGFIAMVTMQSWMFLSSFEKLRNKLLTRNSFDTFIQIGYNSFPELNSKVALASAFVLRNSNSNLNGIFINTNDAPQSSDKELVFFERKMNEQFYIRNSMDLKSIPGNPIAYWLDDNFIDCFTNFSSLGSYSRAAKGLVTANNEEFVREWFEVPYKNIGFNIPSRVLAENSGKKWFPYAKGGEFRRWFGNIEHVVNWEKDGQRIRNDLTEDGKRVRATNFNLDRIFKKGISWTVVTTSKPSFRQVPEGCLFDAAAGIIQSDKCDENLILGYLNSIICQEALAAINPTLNLHPGYLECLPFEKPSSASKIIANVKELNYIFQNDWDLFERSWNFKQNPLIAFKVELGTLEDSFNNYYAKNKDIINRVSYLEQENNSLFASFFKLENQLSLSIDRKNITLLSNPYYRYSVDKSDEQLKKLFLSDTIIDFLSYFVGVVLGRYSLNEVGLQFSGQEVVRTKSQSASMKTFLPDEDNVIPIVDFEGDWFEDDITERFKEFLKVTFGQEDYSKNLAFIENAIGKDIKKYFVKDFYDDHVKRYKKRPIYWMFSSPKGSFNALIYMHRYQPDTVSIVLNDYLREFRTKLEARKESYEQVEISASASQKDKTNAIKAISKINKVLEEINDYEHDVLYPLAGEKIEIDLDDGVKHNYPLFGKALKKVTGLS